MIFFKKLISIFIDENITLVIPTYSYLNRGNFYVDKSSTNLVTMNK